MQMDLEEEVQMTSTCLVQTSGALTLLEAVAKEKEEAKLVMRQQRHRRQREYS